MKRTIIIPMLLALTSCTTVKKDDHSYTYIHNFNNHGGSSDAPVSTKRPKIKREVAIDDDAPFYSNGLGSNTDTIGDQQYVQSSSYFPNNKSSQTAQNKIVHNHYYAENGVERPSYNIPPAYSGRYEGFNPAGRRFLMRAEVLNGY